MKIKTEKLIGPALDWAVAKCEEYETHIYQGRLETLFTDNGWKPSINWAQGGPIIEREEICSKRVKESPDEPLWIADAPFTQSTDGPTLLIAAMRCYVASKLGDEIEVNENEIPEGI